jgi:hypothetical protein
LREAGQRHLKVQRAFSSVIDGVIDGHVGLPWLAAAPFRPLSMDPNTASVI